MMIAIMAACLAAALLCAGAGPALAGSPAQYEVASGDNLSVIAARFGVTVQELRKDNGLRSDLIRVGQKLTIGNPLHMTRGRDIRWARPVPQKGPIIKPFGPYKAKGVLMPRTGAEMAAPWGTPLSSPANGVIRHIGHMDGFGTLMIIEHGGGYASVLAPFARDRVEVAVGQAVRRGTRLGVTAPPDQQYHEPYVHLELRKNDKAIQPNRLFK